MIRFNLSLLLTERNLKITKVSHDTGISRTTLTYLYYNYAKGIQLDTLNLLCNYLKVTPDQLISYVPVDIEISEKDLANLNQEIPVLISKRNEIFRGKLELSAQFGGEQIEPVYKSERSIVECLNIRIGLPEDSSLETKNNNDFILETFHSLPITFFKDIENRAYEIIENRWRNDNEIFIDDFEIYWDNGLDAKI